MAVFSGNGTAGSPSFTFSSSNTTGIYRPSADAITLVTGGVNRFTIKGTSTILSSTTSPRTNVRGLFGTVTPSFNVEQAIGYISVVSDFDNTTNGAPGELQLCRSGATAILSNTTVVNGNWLGMISFQGADGSDMEYAARIRAIADGTVAANQMPGTMIFETTPAGSATPTEVVRMTTDKYLRMASGTGGIQFNGDTAAANALDDYEEGTFAPVIAGTSSAGVGTYTFQWGYYTKIGDVVNYSINIFWTAHTGTGNMIITNLPYTAKNLSNRHYTAPVWANNVATPSTSQKVTGYVGAGTSQFTLQYEVLGGSVGSLPLDAAGSLIITGMYLAA